MSTSESGDGKLGKLKAKLKRLSEKIDAADQRTVDAKANIIEAIARLEKAECEVGSIERRTQLLGTDLKIATERGEELSTKLEKVVGESTEIEEARQALEANEAEGDEKISSLEEELRKARLTLEENQIKLIDMERKYVVVKSDMERGKTKADALEARVAQLEGSMADANTSLKELEVKEGASSEQEQKNAEAILVLDGQLKDAEVRAEAATRSCQVLEHNTQETQGIIDEYNEKIKQLESEIVQMNELAGEIESDEDE